MSEEQGKKVGWFVLGYCVGGGIVNVIVWAIGGMFIDSAFYMFASDAAKHISNKCFELAVVGLLVGFLSLLVGGVTLLLGRRGLGRVWSLLGITAYIAACLLFIWGSFLCQMFDLPTSQWEGHVLPEVSKDKHIRDFLIGYLPILSVLAIPVIGPVFFLVKKLFQPVRQPS